MKSLRMRMITSITSIVVLALIAISALNLFEANKFIQEDTRYRLEKSAENQAETINRWFDVYKTQITTLARSPIITSGNREEALKYLAVELKNNPIYQNIYISESSGKSYGANGAIINVSDRESFQKPIKGETVISDTQDSITTEKLIVVIATPIFIDGKIDGVLTGIITVDNIIKQVLNVKIQETGYAYVVNKNGTVIIHPNSDISNKKNILKGLDFAPEINKFGEEVVNGESGFTSYLMNGEKKYAAYTRIPEMDWFIIVTVPENEVNSELINNTMKSIIIIIGMLVLVIFVIVLITKSIVTPIEILEANANRIANGDLNNTILNINSKDEIGRLAQAFEKMIENLYASYEELEASNEEILASEEELKKQNEILEQSREALQKTEELFILAARSSKVSIWNWEIGEKDKFTYYELGENMTINEIAYTLDSVKNNIHPENKKSVMEAIKEHLYGEKLYFECEFREKTKDGDYKWVLSRGKAIRDCDGKPIRFTGSNTDITELKNADEKIKYMANYDLLTSLPNRVLLNERISIAFSEVKINKSKIALLYLDLDNFKTVNDMLGHNYGDILLKDVSKKLEGCVSNSDTVSRLGGDEFAILLTNINEFNYIIEIVEKINSLFKNPYVLNCKEFFITASIGITVYPDDGDKAEILMKNADTAMYSAKKLGKNGYQFYNETMKNKVIERIEMENNLRYAIERDELIVYYQPQIDLKNGRISGFEALIRWNSPSKGMISPMEFIPIAEETGLIIPIGEWVLHTACKQTKLWQDKGYYPFNIAINLSAKQFRQANLVEIINNIIVETGINPKDVELEITETMAMENINDTIKTLDRLKNNGITIALDDFGTGYSSLNYLKKLPIDILKIDKDFIYEIADQQNQDEIVNIIISLAHSMNLKVVAEGVETVDKLDFLKQHNCDKVQGYYFSKPLNKEDTENLLKSNMIFKVTKD